MATTYSVQRGDTLWEIAQKLLGDGSRWKELYVNGTLASNIDPRTLQVGATITTTAPSSDTSSGDTSSGSTASGASYTVQRGDTLWQIAQDLLGDGSRWKELYVNGQSASNIDPRTLQIGATVTTTAAGGGGGDTTDPGSPAPEPEPDPITQPTPTPPRAPEPTTPPTPAPTPEPEPEPINWLDRARSLYPWLPRPLLQIFADAWADSGDASLALAEMRASPEYDRYYPGNKRSDGSLRYDEAQYASVQEAYRQVFRDFNLNPDVFAGSGSAQGRFVELLEGNVSPSELASRMAAAYEDLVTNIPQVRQAYTEFGGLELTDEAIFASIIDPDVGDALINRRISVAQIAGEGLARGFSSDQAFAQRLADAGVDQLAARRFFSDAEGRLPTLDELARRFRDPDPDFDVEEFAEATVFGDASQRRRIRRLFAAESAQFSERFGSIATSDTFELEGISAQ